MVAWMSQFHWVSRWASDTMKAVGRLSSPAIAYDGKSMAVSRTNPKRDWIRFIDLILLLYACSRIA